MAPPGSCCGRFRPSSLAAFLPEQVVHHRVPGQSQRLQGSEILVLGCGGVARGGRGMGADLLRRSYRAQLWCERCMELLPHRQREMRALAPTHARCQTHRRIGDNLVEVRVMPSSAKRHFQRIVSNGTRAMHQASVPRVWPGWFRPACRLRADPRSWADPCSSAGRTSPASGPRAGP